MFVKSQDGAVVLNNDKVTEYSTDSKYDGRYKVAALVGESRVVTGRYSTKEKCIICFFRYPLQKNNIESLKKSTEHSLK